MPTISFSGLASGIDGDAVIKALLDSRRLAGAPLEKKIEANTKETDALEEFNTKLLTLNDKVQDFLTLSGSAVSKNASSSNEDAVEVTAGANALASSQTFEVLSLASNATVSFADRFTSLTQPLAAGLGAPASMSITIGTGTAAETVSVEVDSTTTLAGLAEKINQAASGKVFAHAINVSTGASPQYVLVMNSVASGTEKGALSVSVPPELGLFQTQTASEAKDAVLNVDGVGQFTRSSNQISDIFPGLTLQLKQENTGPVTVSVAADAEKTAEKLNEMIDAFNELVKFSHDNSKIERVEDEDGVTNVYGTLARTRIDEQAIDSIRSALAGAVSAIEGSEIRSPADLGIATQRDGTLKFDKTVFVSAVGKNSAAVEDILHRFADKVGSAQGVVSQYTRFQGMIDQAQEANKDDNENLNERLERLERSLESQRQMMQQTFARLESTISRMNSASSSLTGVLAGLAASKK